MEHKVIISENYWTSDKNKRPEQSRITRKYEMALSEERVTGER